MRQNPNQWKKMEKKKKKKPARQQPVVLVVVILRWPKNLKIIITSMDGYLSFLFEFFFVIFIRQRISSSSLLFYIVFHCGILKQSPIIIFIYKKKFKWKNHLLFTIIIPFTFTLLCIFCFALNLPFWFGSMVCFSFVFYFDSGNCFRWRERERDALYVVVVVGYIIIIILTLIADFVFIIFFLFFLIISSMFFFLLQGIIKINAPWRQKSTN